MKTIEQLVILGQSGAYTKTKLCFWEEQQQRLNFWGREGDEEQCLTDKNFKGAINITNMLTEIKKRFTKDVMKGMVI